jgi:hypothetical protein
VDRHCRALNHRPTAFPISPLFGLRVRMVVLEALANDDISPPPSQIIPQDILDLRQHLSRL